MKDKIAIGKILTSHGIKGFVKVKSLSGESEHFKNLKEIIIMENDLSVCLHLEDVKIANKFILIKFSGINTPEKAKELRNHIIWTDIKHACELKNDEYYYKDIYHCDVYKNGDIIGKVKSIFEGANSDNLEIMMNNNKIVVVPFINEFVGEVNIREKKIFIKEGCVII